MRDDGPSPFAVYLVALVIDALIVCVTFLAAVAIRLQTLDYTDLLPLQLLVICALMAVGLSLHQAYDLQRVRNGQDLLSRLCLGVLVGLGLIVLLSYVAPELGVGRGVFLLHGVLLLPLLLVWRRFLFRSLREGRLRPRALVLGRPEVALKVARAAAEARFGGAEAVGILVPPGAPGAHPRPQFEAPPRAEPADGEVAVGQVGPILGDYSVLREAVERLQVTQLIVVTAPIDEAIPVAELLALRREGMAVEQGEVLYEELTGKLLVEKLSPGHLIFANALEKSDLEMQVRAVVETLGAAVLLVLMAPVLLAVAIAVKLSSPGPIIFRQERVGKQGRPFDVLKFRTMGVDAEAGTGPVWATAADPRVTRVGRILRTTRLDELPQLWNVLRGDMSFVGPRPERPSFVAMLGEKIPHYHRRHTVKPGVTGWAQINYRYGASVEDAAEKLHYDLYYIQNMSVLLDLDIVLGTIRVVLGVENEH